MARKFKNFWVTTLSQTLAIAGTTMVVPSADAALIPTLASGDTFTVTLYDGTQAPEIVLVTAVSGQNLTITRAQESTVAVEWAGGTKARHVVTATDAAATATSAAEAAASATAAAASSALASSMATFAEAAKSLVVGLYTRIVKLVRDASTSATAAAASATTASGAATQAEGYMHMAHGFASLAAADANATQVDREVVEGLAGSLPTAEQVILPVQIFS